MCSIISENQEMVLKAQSGRWIFKAMQRDDVALFNVLIFCYFLISYPKTGQYDSIVKQLFEKYPKLLNPKDMSFADAMVSFQLLSLFTHKIKPSIPICISKSCSINCSRTSVTKFDLLDF